MKIIFLICAVRLTAEKSGGKATSLASYGKIWLMAIQIYLYKIAFFQPAGIVGALLMRKWA